MYNSYFDAQIRQRGYDYFKSNKVKNINFKDNVLTANVLGTEEYSVKVVFNNSDDNIIDLATCNCPYFEEDQKYCKHIYAAILSVKDNDKKSEKELFKKEIKQTIKNTKKHKKRQNSISLLDVFKVFGSLFSNPNQKEYTEEELDELGLDDDEKEAIMSGDYIPENFDMDNWDEENYYYSEDEDKPE